MNIKALIKINYVIDCTIIAKSEKEILHLAYETCADLGFKCRIVKIISMEETTENNVIIF